MLSTPDGFLTFQLVLTLQSSWYKIAKWWNSHRSGLFNVKIGRVVIFLRRKTVEVFAQRASDNCTRMQPPSEFSGNSQRLQIRNTNWSAPPIFILAEPSIESKTSRLLTETFKEERAYSF